MDEAKANRQNVDDLPAICADESGMALLRAAGANDVHSVRQLLEKGTNPNMYEKYGRKTPLILAAEFGCYEVMNDLLEHRASICQTDRWGNTPLHCAAAGGHLNCVKFLLQHHSPLEVVNHRKCTPLMRAAIKGRTEIVRHLLDNNAIVSSQLNENKESALTLGCGSGKVDLVKLLLERGSPVADRSAELNAALREAVLFGRVELVQILLNHGADANHSDDTNSPVIFLSIDSNKVSILDLLIAHGANIEQLDGQDYTPLMKAAKTGKREMVAALLAAGANPKVRRKVDRKTALSLARSQGHKEICKIILKAKVKKTS
ncbi:ankyrin domain repeat containing protein [Echinococcus multilocularis]|uniref:Ankyrin domain repeat containing protein n=1 Tax=Echinococcus multilocularis TaxID=6211 RepID=A0A068XUY0_ECHMU|nr:ankyrin domain repeat containing protein [Echinococcus multilocularis]